MFKVRLDEADRYILGNLERLGDCAALGDKARQVLAGRNEPTVGQWLHSRAATERT